MVRKWVWWSLVGIWCLVIYCFSEASYFTGENTAHILQKWIGHEGWEEGEGAASPLNFVIRKFAHLSAFGILAVLVFQALYPKRWAYVWAWSFAAVYAATDEWHQSFEPGRTALFSDVVIDACGALVALCLVWMWQQRRKPARLKRKIS
ncbi:VanZ family protein [Anoxybacillus sp. PDR2]|uniref:VanZ family protein n=1 Tax=Anoxybacillaceae TaxID=3120669 RepID=UPI00131657A9|nr:MULTISPECIES: VanZ family protein [Anoxybacillus]MBS2771290.1 VanZ family protein [Anoxybacillus rupiensis]QHC05511.1 VanZ family protein [Anoxybacillus sp. PDR2]